MGRLFYGIRQSNGALFQAATSPASFSGITISSGATSVVLSSSNHTAIKTLFDATPVNQALYFVESTYTTAFPSVGGLINDTSVNIYQIVSETQSNLSIIFGKQGNGIITINTK